MSKPAENKMGVMPENKLLLNMAVPMILSMLVQALYNAISLPASALMFMRVLLRVFLPH